MTTAPTTPPERRESSIIPASSRSVTALPAATFLIILLALGLRLLFVLRFPGSADDSQMYIDLARVWADHHVYGFMLNGEIVPTDLRTPGYPAFLAGVALFFGRSLRAIMLSQAVVDVLTCVLTAALAAALAPAESRRRVGMIALGLAATCPFLANYTAVVLTETLVTFLATGALCCFTISLQREFEGFTFLDGRWRPTPFAAALAGAFLTGLASLVRPEMPLLMGVATLVLGLREFRILGISRTLALAAALAGAFLLPLLPWAARNLVTLKKVQFLAPRYAVLPDEYAPVGFYAWNQTWLERYRDVYFTIWKIGEPDQPLNVDELPQAAFDSPQEKAQVAELFAAYNNNPDLDISPAVDATFAEIARERTRRHPLRTYFRVPFQRALTIWFTPRTEMLDIDGKFFPVREQWKESRVNVLVTGSFAVLGYAYALFATMGILAVWRSDQRMRVTGPAARPHFWGIALIVAYLVIRTAFLTTVEAPEPRYVVSCYPAVLALAALLDARKHKPDETA